MIRAEEVQALDQRLKDALVVEEHATAFQRDEPYIYSWMSSHAKGVLEILSRNKRPVEPRLMAEVYNNICRAYMFMHYLARRKRDPLIDRLLASDPFESFIEGTMDERFYAYDIDGMDPASTLVLAKRAHQRHALETLRKQLLPILAEDMGRGRADSETVRRVDTLDLRDAA